MSCADDAIKEICSQIVATGEGVRFDGMKDALLTDEENIIITELRNDKQFGFNKLQDKIRFYYSFDKDFFPLVFHNIYGKLKKEKNEKYDRFKELLVEDLNKQKKLKIKKYDLYFPINIKTEKKISKFKYNNIEVDFLLDKKIIEKILKDTRAKHELTYNKNFNLSKTVLCKISLRGRNRPYATKKAEEIFDFLLGVISFYETYWGNPRTLMGIPKPLSKLNQYYIFVFENNKYASYLYYQGKEDKTQIVELKEDWIKAINSTIKRAIKSKQQELIFRLFTSYFKGSTEKYVDYSFLCFWRIIEIGILKEPSQKHKEIVDILKSLVIELKSRTKYKLDRFYQLRNNFVHEGVADITQYDRNGMKSFAQMIINIYCNTLYNKDIEEIKLFYYYVKRKHSIKKHISMAKKIDTLLKQAKKGAEK